MTSIMSDTETFDHWYYLSAFYVCSSCLILLSLHLCGIFYWFFCTRRQFRVQNNTPVTFPGVTIIKPLVGTDPNTKVNLESFFKLSYPKFQLLICIQNLSDPAFQIVRELKEAYKSVDVQVFSGSGEKQCANPKINNMLDAYDKAKYELIMISDSRIFLPNEALVDIVQKMEDDVGIVHQMPFTSDSYGFPRAVEKVCFGTQQARMYTVLNLMGTPCLTGMSFMFRKSVIDSCGGISAFGSYLAEDFFIGKAFTDRNWKMRLSTFPALQNPGNCSLNEWLERMVRWGQLRVRLSPIAWFEPLQDCMISALLTTTALYYMHSFNFILVFLSYISIWFLLDIALLMVIQEIVLAWVFREITAFYIYTQAVTKSHVLWRTYKIKIGWSTKATHESAKLVAT